MAVGTSGGLLDAPKPTSMFKHEILRQYTSAFLAKVASSSSDHRVMVIDGFAGRGRFDNGSPGSAELFMRAAAGLSNVKTSIRLFEMNRSDAAKLADVCAEYAARGLDVTSERADIAARLEDTVATASGIALFVFLDPCGQNLPFDLLVKVLGQTRSARWPPSEALLNLSADFTRRIGGSLEKGHDSAGLETMDRVVGGKWWRQLALDVHAKSPDGSWESAAEAVATEYLRLLSEATRMSSKLVAVRRKPENQPTYHLAYLTRSNDGHWVMADALARARQVWLREVGPQPSDGQFTLFGTDPIDDMIEAEQDAARARTKTRVIALATRAKAFTLIPNVLEVYGDDYGVLTQSNLTVVMANLKKEGRLARVPGEKVGRATFTFVQ